MRRALSNAVMSVASVLVVSLLLAGGVFGSRYVAAVHTAKEAVLAEDLGVLREAAKDFTKDRKRPPADVAELVQTGYLKSIPINPINQRQFKTW